MRLQLKIVCLAVAVCLLTATAALAKDSKCKWWPPREPRPVAVVNTPAVTVPEGVAITNTPGVWVVNDGANPVPVVVQNPATPGGGGGLSEVTVINGPGEPVPVQQTAAHHTIFLTGMIPGNQQYKYLELYWPADKAFLVKTVALWCEGKVRLYFPVASEVVSNPNDFIILLTAPAPGVPAVENLHGGVLLRESGINCRLDKLEADVEYRNFRLLITGELLPK